MIPSALAAGAFLVGQTEFSSSFSGRTPFTLHLREESTAVKGGTPLSRATFVAVRFDGSRAWGDAMYADNPAPFTGVRTVALAPEQVSVVLDRALRIKTTYLLTGPDLSETPRDPSCKTPQVDPRVQYVVKGEETVLGVPAVVIEYRHDDAIRTQWEAPSLNCETIKLMEEIIAGGEVVKRFERSPLEIQLGEPSADLFAIPAEYVEKSPMQKQIMRAQVAGRPMDPRWMQGIEREDARYYTLLEKAHAAGKLPAGLQHILFERRFR